MVDDWDGRGIGSRRRNVVFSTKEMIQEDYESNETHKQGWSSCLRPLPCYSECYSSNLALSLGPFCIGLREGVAKKSGKLRGHF